MSHYYDIAKATTRAAWPLTVPGSVVIWDDYAWGYDLPQKQRGATAIDEFLRERDGSYRVLGAAISLRSSAAGEPTQNFFRLYISVKRQGE